MREFNRKFALAFPNYWGILTFIAHEFCGVTRVHMMSILDSYNNKIDVKNLLNALRATIKFENKLYEDLRKEYQQYIDRPSEKENNQVTPNKKDEDDDEV